MQSRSIASRGSRQIQGLPTRFGLSAGKAPTRPLAYPLASQGLPKFFLSLIILNYPSFVFSQVNCVGKFPPFLGTGLTFEACRSELGADLLSHITALYYI